MHNYTLLQKMMRPDGRPRPCVLVRVSCGVSKLEDTIISRTYRSIIAGRKITDIRPFESILSSSYLESSAD